MRWILLDLPPQISDVDIDHAGLDRVLVAPHMVEDLFAGQHFAGVRGEERQQVELRVGQQHLTGIVEDAALVEIDDQILEFQAALVDGFLFLTRLSQMGRDSSQQLARAEGLGDVVVRTDFQPDHDVDLFGFGAEDDDRHPQAGFANVPADVETRHIRKHDVEQDQIGFVQLDAAEGLGTGLRLDHLVALLFEGEMDRLADHRLIVDDQDSLRRWHQLVRADGEAWPGAGGRFRPWHRDGEDRALSVPAANMDLAAQHGD